MRGVIAGILLGAASAAVTGAAAPALAAPPIGPELASCPPLKPLDEPASDRTRPLPVPASFAMLVASSRDRLAVSTIYGGTTCVDTRAIGRLSGLAVSDDRRFVSFDWTGYETGGHLIVDRTGRGQTLETGARPVFSPSRRAFAAVQQSEAAFGTLEGFGVWRVGVVGLREAALQQDIPSLADWRIDGWVGEDCINLSGIPHDRLPAGRGGLAKVRRDRYIASQIGEGWVVMPSPGGCPTG